MFKVDFIEILLVLHKRIHNSHFGTESFFANTAHASTFTNRTFSKPYRTVLYWYAKKIRFAKIYLICQKFGTVRQKIRFVKKSMPMLYICFNRPEQRKIQQHNSK
jgi:hypothetical protein